MKPTEGRLGADQVASEEWSRRLAGYSLEPPVSLRRVEEFEERNGVVLPAEYRTFITTICSGIDVDPDQEGRLSGLLAAPDFDRDDDSLRRPFPLVEYQYFDDDEDYERASGGQLYAATDGCTCDWYLIVTGPERGGMWQIEADGAQPCAPKLTFLPWLELRLDCDSGRDDREWWDVVWRDFEADPAKPKPMPVSPSEELETLASREVLKDALLAELTRRFGDAFHPGDDPHTVAIFPAAHPEVGDVIVRDEGDEAIVFLGDITHEHFSSDVDAEFDTARAEEVARDVADFLSELFADRILLWQAFFGWIGGYRLLPAVDRSRYLERWARCCRWSGPIQSSRASSRIGQP